MFLRLSEIFNCAKWEIHRGEHGFTAESYGCRLCAITKKVSNASPCHIYCLNPMEGMVKGINQNNTFEVKETLWDGQKCRIEVEERISGHLT